MQQGGKRDGAGRPRESASVMQSDTIVARKLKSSAEKGFEVLAGSYAKLMHKAIAMALEGDKSMLKTLVELMPRIVGTEADQADSKITKLVENFLDRLPNPSNTKDGAAVDEDSRGRVEPVDGTDATGTTAHSSVRRVGGGI